MTISTPGGRLFLQVVELGLDALDEAERVLAVAHHDDGADRLAQAVELGGAAPRLGPEAHAPDVLHAHARALGRSADGDLGEPLQILQVAATSHEALASAELDDAAADLGVGSPHGPRHVVDRDAEGAEPLGVERDLVLALEAPDAGDLRHAGHALEHHKSQRLLTRTKTAP